MAKKKKVNNTIPLHLVPYIGNDAETLKGLCFLCEQIVYQTYLRRYTGDIGKIRAFVSSVEDMVAKGKRPELKAYYDEVIEYMPKYFVDFELELFDKEEEIDEL